MTSDPLVTVHTISELWSPVPAGGSEQQPQEQIELPQVSPFHTNSPEYPPEHRNVYHDNSACDDGARIKSWHRVDGTGNRPRCDECNHLAREGR